MHSTLEVRQFFSISLHFLARRTENSQEESTDHMLTKSNYPRTYITMRFHIDNTSLVFTEGITEQLPL